MVKKAAQGDSALILPPGRVFRSGSLYGLCFLPYSDLVINPFSNLSK